MRPAAANAQAVGDYAGGGQQSADNGGGSPALSPEVKQAIADEVKAQLEAEKAAPRQHQHREAVQQLPRAISKVLRQRLTEIQR